MTNKQTKTIKIIIPIYGLGWILNNIKLDNNTEIRFIDYLKKEDELLKKSGFNRMKYNCVLDIKYSYDPQDISQPYLALQFLLDKIQAALRIFSPGFIVFSGIISKPSVQPFPLSINSTILGGPPFYQIDKEKLRKFPGFYQKFKIVYQKKPVVFDYFSRAQGRYANNDKTIDYCICLESLFVPEKERSRKKAFILQGLKILGIKNKDITIISDLYEYRSAIVHGNRKKQLKLLSGKKYTLEWFKYCTNLIREIINLYIKTPW